jgi:hypothetical protein
MTDLHELDELLRAEEGDAGCEAGVPIMDQYVEIALRGDDPSERFPGYRDPPAGLPGLPRRPRRRARGRPALRRPRSGLVAVRRRGDGGTHLTDGATQQPGAGPERSAIMTRQHATRSSVVRRLRPAPERFAAAAALQNPGLLLQLRAAQSDGDRPLNPPTSPRPAQ